jgi:hypothetical protein
MYSADLAQGIRPLIVVGSAPSWATTPGAGLLADWNPPDPSNLGDFAAFCAEVARRYPAAVGIEVWNEPNYNRFWGGQQPSPTAYTDLLATAYGAIKSVDPSIAVVSAGMLPFGGNSSTAVSSSSFLSQMFQAGAGRYMDAIGAHLYPARTGAGNHRLFSPWLNEVRALALASGVQLPIWVTEVGITTTGPYGVSEAQQASALTDFFTWIQRQPDVEAFYIHTLTEPTQDNSNPEKGYALLDGSSYPYTPKPAFDAIQQAAQGAPVRGPATQTILVKSVRKWLRALPKKGKVSVSMQCSSWCMANATGKLLVLSAGGGRHRYSLTAAQTPLDEFSKGKLTFTLKPRQRAIVKQALRAGGRVRFRVTVSGRDTVVASKPQSVSARIR